MRDTRSGRVTLRITPQLHRELGDLSDRLGVGLNDLLNLMIRFSLPHFANTAVGFERQRQSAESFYLMWRNANPTRPPFEFVSDLDRLFSKGERVRFEDGVEYVGAPGGTPTRLAPQRSNELPPPPFLGNTSPPWIPVGSELTDPFADWASSASQGPP